MTGTPISRTRARWLCLLLVAATALSGCTSSPDTGGEGASPPSGGRAELQLERGRLSPVSGGAAEWMKVRNVGSGTSGDVRIRVEVAPEWELRSAVSAKDVDCEDVDPRGLLSCRLPPLGPGTTTTVNLYFAVDGATTVVEDASVVDTEEGRSWPGTSDLAITFVGRPVVDGALVTWVIRVRNHGASQAAPARLRVRMPATAVYRSAEPGRGLACTLPDPGARAAPRCLVRPMLPDGQRKLTLTLETLEDDIPRLRVQVTTANDSDVGNNQASSP